MSAGGRRPRRRRDRADTTATPPHHDGAYDAKEDAGGLPKDDPRPRESDEGTSLQEALSVVSKAQSFNERALRSAIAVLDNPEARRVECEAVLARLGAWLAPPTPSQAQAYCAAVGLPGCLVRTMGAFRSTPPVAAAACVAALRSSGIPEGLGALVRARVLEELASLMDEHPTHGGVQNVCMHLINSMARDASVARQAVSLGYVPRIVRAMEATPGRGVQLYGAKALLLLKDGCRGQGGVGLAETAMRAKEAHEDDAEVCNVANDLLAIVTPRFKVVLCWHWQGGWCRHGPRCTYAHGPAELRGGGFS